MTIGLPTILEKDGHEVESTTKWEPVVLKGPTLKPSELMQKNEARGKDEPGFVSLRPDDLDYAISKRTVVYVAMSVFATLIFVFSALYIIALGDLPPAKALDRIEVLIFYFSGVYIAITLACLKSHPIGKSSGKKRRLNAALGEALGAFVSNFERQSPDDGGDER